MFVSSFSIFHRIISVRRSLRSLFLDCEKVHASLKLVVFPDIWRLVKIFQIFKIAAKNDKNIYKPISVVSTFSKVVEKIVHDQLLTI